MGMGDEWRREWGMEMLMLMFASRSIGREMELWRVCTWMIEGGRRCTRRSRGQQARYQLVDEVKLGAQQQQWRLRLVECGW